MIYIIITTSLIPYYYEVRKAQYIRCINQLIKLTQPLGYKIIIVENNGKRPTFLDDFGVDVVYTNTNFTSPMTNIGYKEMTDVKIILELYNIQDDDFVIKATGRYFLYEDSPVLENINKGYDAICKYGHLTFNCCECGIIGLSGKLFYLMELPEDNTIGIELKYAECINKHSKNKCVLQKVGMSMAPSYYGMENYQDH